MTKNTPKRILVIVLWIILVAMLIAWVGYTSYLYYAGSCKQIKDFPVPQHVPNRCIGINL